MMFHHEGRFPQVAWFSPSAGGATIPGQFGTSDWSVADGGNDGAIVITITVLPGNGGSAILDLEYQIDGGSWVSLDGTTTGTYGVSGLTNAVSVNVAIRAVNAIGNGTASATKAVTPTVGNFEDLALQIRFQESNGATTGADDSASNFDWTASGNADVQSNQMPLDGTGDFLDLASDADDWNFLHGGIVWTMEFEVVGRPTAANNTVFSTNAGSSANRGIWIGITSAGALRVLMTKTAGLIMVNYTSGWTVPNDAALHRIVIECDFGDGAVTDVFRFGMDGVRQDLEDRAAVTHSIADSSFDLRIGRANTSTADYNGTIGPLRIFRERLRYDLLNNATYTEDAVAAWPTSAVTGPKSFAARVMLKPETAAAGFTWHAYMAEPRVVATGTPGEFKCFAYFGSNHAANTDADIMVMTSTDWGKSWSNPVTVATDATYSCRNAEVGVDSNGVIIVCYRKYDGVVPTAEGGVWYRTSADNYATETEITSSLDGTAPFGKGVETTDGLLFTFYKADFAECLYWDAGTETFGTAVEIYDETGTTPGYNEPFAFSDGADQVVWVARRDGSGNNDYAWYKSTDAGATTSFLEEVQWTGTTFGSAAPAALALIGDKVVCVWNSRNTAYQLKYTISGEAAFWADPGRMMDGTVTINTLRNMREISGNAAEDFGYADIVPLRNDLALVTNYEAGIDNTSLFTRLWAQTLSV
jgi:hypothetical protein